MRLACGNAENVLISSFSAPAIAKAKTTVLLADPLTTHCANARCRHGLELRTLAISRMPSRWSKTAIRLPPMPN